MFGVVRFGKVSYGQAGFGLVRSAVVWIGQVGYGMEKTEKILLGMNRPDWYEFKKKVTGSYVYCCCGDMLSATQSLFEHWQRGHFDSPVFATKDEMIKAKLIQLEERRARKL